MPDEIAVHLSGVPRPQPRPRRGKSGNFISTQDKGIKKYRDAVMKACRDAVKEDGAAPWEAVDAEFLFWFGTDKAERHGQPHTFVPDKDNLEKLWLDCAVKAGLLRDDCIVSAGAQKKRWSIEDGVLMVLREDRV